MAPALFSELIGHQLSSVIFVQDYLQLDFDGNRMTLYVWPTLHMAYGCRRFGEVEYRNALCSFIAKRISRIDLHECHCLILHFGDTPDTIYIALDTGHEALYYTQHEGGWLSL
jgi:hypothetical protein